MIEWNFINLFDSWRKERWDFLLGWRIKSFKTLDMRERIKRRRMTLRMWGLKFPSTRRRLFSWSDKSFLSFIFTKGAWSYWRRRRWYQHFFLASWIKWIFCQRRMNQIIISFIEWRRIVRRKVFSWRSECSIFFYCGICFAIKFRICYRWQRKWLNGYQEELWSSFSL